MASHAENPTTYISYHGDRPEMAIAEANFKLPDSEPRKITREQIVALRESIADEHEFNDSDLVLLNRLADALESYLPSRP